MFFLNNKNGKLLFFINIIQRRIFSWYSYIFLLVKKQLKKKKSLKVFQTITSLYIKIKSYIILEYLISAVPNLFSSVDHQFRRKSLRSTNSYKCKMCTYVSYYSYYSLLKNNCLSNKKNSLNQIIQKLNNLMWFFIQTDTQVVKI
jgi:hypothetical protein